MEREQDKDSRPKQVTLSEVAKALTKRWEREGKPQKDSFRPYAASAESTRRALIASLTDEDY